MKNFTLITGACGGLGKSFVKLCLFEKQNLLLTGTSEKKINLLIDELKKDYQEIIKDIEIKTFVLDLSKSEQRENIIEFIKYPKKP